MKASLSHIQFLIDFGHVGFYNDFFALLGWKEVFHDEGIVGFFDGSPKSVSLWFLKALDDGVQNHDESGMNHVAMSVETQADVDAVVKWLEEKDVTPEFDTPRHRPEFAQEEGKTYYQVMFHTPDNILFEVVYNGPKA